MDHLLSWIIFTPLLGALVIIFQNIRRICAE